MRALEMAIGVLLCGSVSSGIAASMPPVAIDGSWRIVQGVAGPWAAAGTVTPTALRKLAGQRLVFTRNRITGAPVLSCGRVSYEVLDIPPEGLFQGGLPAPAEIHARELGMTRLPAPSVRVNCDSGSFDYHLAEAATLRVALDNVVWTLVFHPVTAREAVESFMRAHFSGDMGFTPDSIARKQRWLTHELGDEITRYFARARPADAVPPVNGDPFTDTQEYPTGFSIAQVHAERHRARVRVDYRGSGRSVEFQLTQTPAEGWRIDDVLSAGASLRATLRSE